jgi:hypothetical protein
MEHHEHGIYWREELRNMKYSQNPLKFDLIILLVDLADSYKNAPRGSQLRKDFLAQVRFLSRIIRGLQ